MMGPYASSTPTTTRTGLHLARRIVSPDHRDRPGWCQDKIRRDGVCGCFPAGQVSTCPSCDTVIKPGHCIVRKRDGYYSGWVHRRCPVQLFGRRAVLEGLQSAVDYGDLSGAHSPDEATTPTRKRLDFGNNGDNSQDNANERPAKAARIEGSPGDRTGGGRSASSSGGGSTGSPTSGGGNRSSSSGGEGSYHKLTNEQQKILDHAPELGAAPVCVNALAGCGKTTTIAMLCNHLQRQNEDWNILYVVFGKKTQMEAMASNKFPQHHMDIRTTHSFVKQHYFGDANTQSFEPESDYGIEDIIAAVNLKEELKKLFPYTDSSSEKFKRILESAASYIKRTVHNFQASDHHKVSSAHLFYKAKHDTNLSPRSSWRNIIPLFKYQNWATVFFNVVRARCRRVRATGGPVSGITYDGYLKVAQLEQLVERIPILAKDYQVVVVDEAQDMTPCQASLFWGSRDGRPGQAIYVFGDPYQQLYRFRGATQSFREMCDFGEEDTFTLTGSFRFGSEIAKAASVVLRAVDKIHLDGRALDPGKLGHHSGFSSSGGGGVVLCRTRRGMIKYLLRHKPKKWCYLDGKDKVFPKVPAWVKKLEHFLRSAPATRSQLEALGHDPDRASRTFKYKGEEFVTVDELHGYTSDEGDNNLFHYVVLLRLLKEEGKTMDEFSRSLHASFAPLYHGTNPNEYDGVVLGTIHQSKGMEFDRVLVYDDFKFGLLNSGRVSRQRFQDEASALYVAITRAKKHLFLCEEAWTCLDTLSRRHSGAALEAIKSMQEIREAWNTNWKQFWAAKAHIMITGITDIPWPCTTISTDESNPLALDGTMTEQEQRSYLRSVLIRFHPDKFLPPLRDSIEPSAVAGIKEKLQDLVRECHKAIRQLQNPD